MPKIKERLLDNILNGFQSHKGKASLYCFTKEFIPEIVYNVANQFHKKFINTPIFICVDGYATRKAILDCFREHDFTEDKGHRCIIISGDYIKLKYNYAYRLTIIVGINDNFEIIKHLNNNSKFTLAILTKNIMNHEFINSVRNILPCIDTGDADAAIRHDSIYSPVEEHRIGVELSAEDKERYDKYTDYITTSVSIFGDLDNIEKCKKGDIKLGISAADFRDTIARENGWREDLDTSVPFMRQIDDIYNPNILFERACTFYNITKERRNLVTDNDAKLAAILKLCEENKDKQILIISKRGDFAAKVSKYINTNSTENIYCGDYHDCLDDIFAVDERGNAVLIKSGANKGKPKMLGSQAQSSLNEQRFNLKLINILSIKSASNPKLKIACDMVIFTSPICDSIIDVKKRFPNVVFNGNITKTFMFYCINTVEYDKLCREETNPIIKVINETEDSVEYDENSVAIIW